MANNSDSALSGGVLVILGIIVAVVVGYLAFSGVITKPSSSTHITVEAPSAPSTPTAPSAPSTPDNPAPAQ